MTRYFSEGSEKKIANAVKWVESNGVDLETGQADKFLATRPARYYKVGTFIENELPSDENGQLMRIECELIKWDLTTKTSTNTGVKEFVLFDHVPKANSIIQASQVNGLTFAASGRYLICVELVKSSGEAGSLTEQCSFKYDVYTHGSDQGTVLGRDVDPIVNGLFARSEFGQYVEATAGLAYYEEGNYTEIQIAWCNEVFAVAECESTQNLSMLWGGSYLDTLTYPGNTAVTDGPYMMVSNKVTNEKPAPQPLTEPAYKVGSTPTWATVSGTAFETITGQRYTWASGGLISNLRFFIPSSASGLQHELWFIESPTGTPVFTQVLPRFTTNTTDAWVDVPFNKLFKTAAVFDVLLVASRSASSTSFTASWNYQSSSAAPAAGYAHHSANGKTLVFNHDDNGSTDRETVLEAMRTGDTITLGTTEWTIIKTTNGSSAHTFEVLPRIQHSTKGVGSFTFKAITSGAVNYVTKGGHYTSDSEVQGLLSATGYSNVSTSNDGFGIDVEYQQMDVSDDWDLISYSGEQIGAI